MLHSLSFQPIEYKISIVMDCRKIRLNWKKYDRRKNLLLYWVDSFLNESFIFSYTLEAFNSILVNSYSYLNEAHWSLCIVITKLYLTIVWLIMPHIFNIDIHIHSSSRTSSYKIPSLFLEVYTNMMEGQHFQLTWLVKQSQVLVHE